jgi:hypothetical protein
LNDYSAQLAALITRSLSTFAVSGTEPDDDPSGQAPDPWQTPQSRQQGLSAILRELIANGGKPWHADAFSGEQGAYADAVAAAWQAKSNASQGASQRHLSLSELPAEAQALAVPTCEQRPSGSQWKPSYARMKMPCHSLPTLVGGSP